MIDDRYKFKAYLLLYQMQGYLNTPVEAVECTGFGIGKLFGYIHAMSISLSALGIDTSSLRAYNYRLINLVPKLEENKKEINEILFLIKMWIDDVKSDIEQSELEIGEDYGNQDQIH